MIIKNRTEDNKRKSVIFIFFIIYIICVLYITLFNREPTIRRRVLTPLWEYRKLLHEDSHYWFQQITCNILMLVPFGAYLGYRFKRMTIIQATVLGGAFSVIECRRKNDRKDFYFLTVARLHIQFNYSN